MSNQCQCCSGRCVAPPLAELSRREFLEKIAAGTAALTLAGQPSWAKEEEFSLSSVSSKASSLPAYPLTPPRVYRGKNLDGVGMPLGGIGTGSIWLDGQGRLGVWQIFNNPGEPRIPDSFFGVAVRSGAGPAQVRVLQTAGERTLKPIQSLEYEGGYPIARLAFQDDSLPIQVSLEALNPLIPLDAANSSIPCVLARLTAKNTGTTAADVTLFGTLQNAVGCGGGGGTEGTWTAGGWVSSWSVPGGIQGVRFGGYGGNRNRVIRENGLAAVAMDKSADPIATGPVKVRNAAGREVPGKPMFWLAALAGLSASAAGPLAHTAAEGGVLLAAGVAGGFFKTLSLLRSKDRDFSSVATVFEDFENDNYDGWTITGNAFAKRPSRGTEPGQQPVKGFAGRGLVNTFQGGDASQGTATSKPFAIERRYIGFLLGGGQHPGQACVNLIVDGRVVRTATGKNQEKLEPACWDVGPWKGKQGVIEIVDRNSGGWGHINVDRILFSDISPEPLLGEGTPAAAVAQALGIVYREANEGSMPAGQSIVIADTAPAEVKAAAGQWRVTRYTRLVGFREENGYRVLATTAGGDPLVIEGPLGKGRILLALAPGLPWIWGAPLLLAARGEPLQEGQRLVPGNPAWGTMTLAALDAPASVLSAWTRDEELSAWLANPTKTGSEEAVSPHGESINAALGVPMTLLPGQSRSVTLAITWHFPNVQRFQHEGNLYCLRWSDATAVARYLAKNLDGLWQRTRLTHETIYSSNLPEEFLDAMTSQIAILRGPTCFWSEDGYFGGYEGSYGCCPLNCTHVWNYAQTHARLFPAVGQNMRISNFVTFLHPNGETSHREHAVHNAFIDGHCACIEAACREYQLSPDRRFLETVWPGVKKAIDWLIEAIDKPREGVPHGHQWNTYDTAVSGANTFIGSQYLASLAAGERMAEVMGDAESVARWRTVREAGMKAQNERLWNGEFYIQIPEAKPARDYNTGCHADQLLGQWWAHMLNLGYLYPAARVQSSLAAILKYNFREKFAGFKQVPRRYIPDDEGGLLICTWPQGGRPKDFILYADEVWTGIEYAVAGAMVYEGQLEAARQVVRMVRSRYDGRRRDGLNSSPGGNPYNELECGKFYARAMSSWSLLTACQGLIQEGPKGLLGFKPHWQPEDHRSFYTAPEGWGLFVQKRSDGQQTERIEVRHGRLRVKELVFALPKASPATAVVTASGQPVAATLHQADGEVRLVLNEELTVPEDAALEVTFRWTA